MKIKDIDRELGFWLNSLLHDVESPTCIHKRTLPHSLSYYFFFSVEPCFEFSPLRSDLQLFSHEQNSQVVQRLLWLNLKGASGTQFPIKGLNFVLGANNASNIWTTEEIPDCAHQLSCRGRLGFFFLYSSSLTRNS